MTDETTPAANRDDSAAHIPETAPPEVDVTRLTELVDTLANRVHALAKRVHALDEKVIAIDSLVSDEGEPLKGGWLDNMSSRISMAHNRLDAQNKLVNGHDAALLALPAIEKAIKRLEQRSSKTRATADAIDNSLRLSVERFDKELKGVRNAILAMQHAVTVTDANFTKLDKSCLGVTSAQSDRLSLLERFQDQARESIGAEYFEEKGHRRSLHMRTTENATRNEELETSVAQLEGKIDELNKTLHGDVEARKRYEEAQNTNTCPNIDEPAPGLVETMTTLATMLDQVSQEAAERAAHADKLERIEARVSELVVKRLVNADELAAMQDRVFLAMNARDEVLRKEMEKGDAATMSAMTEQAENIENLWRPKLQKAYNWAMKYRDSVMRPSRIGAILYAITGRGDLSRE